MPLRHISIDAGVPAELIQGFDRVRESVKVEPEFPLDVAAAADAVAASGIPADPARVDHTDVPFVTIDPEGSMDLDQALFIERAGEGYRVWYAIADVAAWVAPGGPIDAETRRRGQTFYAPNGRVPLHPPVLSEGAASLLADGVRRPALVWQVDLDGQGRQTQASVARSWVTSVAKLSYEGVQRDLDAGTARESLRLLRDVGVLRQQVEIDRGGVSLNLPQQEVHPQDSTWTIAYRTPLPVEDWNAQISLLVGMAAAEIMLAGGVGILRTLPPAHPSDVERLRHTAKCLHIAWPADMRYAEFVRTLDHAVPAHQAMMNACTMLFRGAAYTLVTPDADGDALVHAALSARYAHATAPLRRLVDRYVGEICVNLVAGTPVPGWVTAALPNLPSEMSESDHRAKQFERGIIDLVEALVLQGRVGQHFTGVVVETEPSRKAATVALAEPAVEGPLTGEATLGEQLDVVLESADLSTGKLAFGVASPAPVESPADESAG